MSSTTGRDRAVFISISAQADNLGDIEIRRVFLDWLRASGCRLIVFTGAMPDAYIAVFALPEDAQLFRGTFRFQLALMTAVLRRRAHLAFAPGPQTANLATGSVARRAAGFGLALAKPAVNLLNTVAVRVAGGQVVSIGRAIRGDHALALRLERLRAAASSIYTVRDTVSAHVLGRPVRVGPDLAFQHVHPDHSARSRPLAIISLRGDKHVDPAGLAGAVAALMAYELEPVFLSQVASDDPRHAALAQELGCRQIAWTDETHGEQLDRVQAAYRGASLVISDRLHALVFGAQYGAIPVAVLHSGNDKLTSTLGHVVPFATVAADAAAWPGLDRALAGDPSRAGVMAAAVAASRAVLDLRAEVVALLGGEPANATDVPRAGRPDAVAERRMPGQGRPQPRSASTNAAIDSARDVA